MYVFIYFRNRPDQPRPPSSSASVSLILWQRRMPPCLAFYSRLETSRSLFSLSNRSNSTETGICEAWARTFSHQSQSRNWPFASCRHTEPINMKRTIERSQMVFQKLPASKSLYKAQSISKDYQDSSCYTVRNRASEALCGLVSSVTILTAPKFLHWLRLLLTPRCLGWKLPHWAQRSQLQQHLPQLPESALSTLASVQAR